MSFSRCLSVGQLTRAWSVPSALFLFTVVAAPGLAAPPSQSSGADRGPASARPPAFSTVQPKIDWESLDEEKADLTSLIVAYKDGAEPAAEGVARLTAAMGGRETRRIRMAGVSAVNIPPGMKLAEAAKRYMADPNVRFVEPNYRVFADAIPGTFRRLPNDPSFVNGALWGLDNNGQNGGTAGADIDAPEAWFTDLGSTNVIVAVLDTGIDYRHPDLVSNMWHNPGETGLDAWGNNMSSNGLDDDANGLVDDVYGGDFYWYDGDPIDDHYHGTHVAGTIGAVGSNRVGVVGVVWRVRLMALKFLGPYGGGSIEGAMAGIEYAIDKGAKIVNNSWGGGGYSQALYDLIEVARANGVLMVCAAGNSGTDNDVTPHYPSSYDNDNILAVAATDRNDILADFSCYGRNSVDIAAPGVDITSTFPTNNGMYGTISGTSMATPHASGVAALLKAMSPKANWDVIKRIIMESAVPDDRLATRCVSSAHLNAYYASRLIRQGAKVRFDRLAYQSSAVATVRVEDLIAYTSSVSVAVMSYSGFASLTNRGTLLASNSVTLYPDDSLILYTGSFSIPALLTPAPVHGNTLVATYTFPVLGGGKTNTSTSAPIDNVPPVISNIRIDKVTDTGFDVLWETDEGAIGEARAGKTLPLTGAWSGSRGLVGWGATSAVPHSVTLSDLETLSHYYVGVRSEDAAGNVSMKPSNPASVNPSDYVQAVTLWARTRLFDDMELGMRRWSHSGLRDCWEYGTPTYANGPPSAYSGNYCWGTYLAGNYPPVMNAWLESEPVAVGDLPRLTFMHWHNITNPAPDPTYITGDFGFVEVNDGHGWIIVSQVGTNSLAYHGPSEGWKKAEFDLSDFANSTLRVRFRLRTDYGLQAAGWYIDDFRIRDVVAPGVWGYDLDQPFDDSPAYAPGANDGDGYAEPGERVKARFLAINGTTSARTNLTGRVDVLSDKVRFEGPTNVVSYGTMAMGELKAGAPPLVFAVTNHPSAAGAVIPVLHTMTDSLGSNWVSTVMLPVNYYETLTGTVRNTLSVPISNATVAAATTGAHPVVTAVTDGAGRYVLNGCVKGFGYMVAASKPGFYLPAAPKTVVPPSSGAVDFTLYRCFAIPEPSAIVTNMPIGTSGAVALRISNTNTAPVDSNLVVRLLPSSSDPALSISVSSGPAPVVVPPGSFTNVTVTLDVDINSATGALTGGILLQGLYVAPALIEVPVTVNAQGVSVTGTVLGTNSLPVPGSLVTASAPDVPTRQATPATNGAYEISGLVPGRTYSAFASAPGYSRTTNIVVAPPAVADFTLGHAYAIVTNALVVLDVEPGKISNTVFRLSNIYTGTPPASVPLEYTVESFLPIPALGISFSPSNGLLAAGTGVDITCTATAGVVPTNRYIGRILVKGNQVNGNPLVVNMVVNVVGSNLPLMTLEGVYPADQDGDGYNEPGETVTLTMRARNLGYEYAYGVTGTVSTTSSYVTVTQPVATFPYTFWPGASYFSGLNPVIAITNTAPEGAVLPFQFVMTDNAGDVWTNFFSLTVGISPDLTASPASFNVTLNEGRSATRTLTVSNASVKTLNVSLRTEVLSAPAAAADIVLTQPDINWEALDDKVADPNSLIVVYKNGSDASAAGVRSLTATLGGEEVLRLRRVGALVVRIAEGAGLAETAKRFMADPSVQFVQPNYRVYADESLSEPRNEPDDPFFLDGSLWAMDNYGQDSGTAGADIDAPEAWAIERGSPEVVVAVLDTGIDYTHEDLAANMWKNPGETGIDAFGQDKASNWNDDDGNGVIDDVYGFNAITRTGDPADDHYHGTHVAGTIGAVGNNGLGVAGVAWNVRLMAVKFLDANGGGLTADAMAGIEYAMDMGVKIINNSWGGGPYDQALRNLIETARTNGVLMICAAGNSGTDNDITPHYPSSYDNDNILAVAATDRRGQRASYSCYGKTSVDIAAPGSDILSTLPTGLGGGPYGTLSGTSMATPHVSGVAALLKSMSPDATWETIKQVIMSSGVHDDSMGNVSVSSAHLSAYRAVRAMQASWLELAPYSMTLASGRATNVVVSFNRSLLAKAGTYKANIASTPRFLGVGAVPVTMTVNPAPVPVVGPVRVDDSSSGDGDGNAEPGETADLYVSLNNIGMAAMQPSTGTVTTVFPGVSILQQPQWGIIFSKYIAEPAVPLRASFPAGPPTNVVFKMTVNEGIKGPWTGLVFSVYVGPLHSVTGRVTDSLTGLPLPDAKVDYVATKIGGTVEADDAGYYRIPGIPAGDSCSLRARSAAYAASMWTNIPVPASNVMLDFALGQPIMSVSPSVVTAAVYVGASTSLTVEVVNDGTGWWKGRARKLGKTRVAFISDVMQLNDVRTLLIPFGLKCDEYESNLYMGYTLSGPFLSNYDLVIADLSGADGYGRPITDEEVDVFNGFVAGGGCLVITGPNVIGSPDNPTLAALMGSTTVGVQADVRASALVASADAAVTGPYGPWPSNTTMSVTMQRYDNAHPDPLQGANPILTVGAGGAAKIMRRRMGEGSAFLWTGNRNGQEWRAEGPLQDVFRNIIVDALAGDTSWLTIGAAEPMAVAPAGSRQTVTLNIQAPAHVDDVVDSDNVVLFAGPQPDRGEFGLALHFQVWPDAIYAASSAGVIDWLNRPLRGDGNQGSCIFQVLYAGPDGTNNPPLPNGQPSGDDVLLSAFPDGLPFGRFGVGHEDEIDFGRFKQLFEIAGLSAGMKVFARAWDGDSIANSVAYGDSPLQTLALTVAETRDFGRWIVNRVVGYPDGSAPLRDWDGDSIPDGYMVMTRREARDPIIPLIASWTQEGVVGSPVTPELYLPGRVAVSSNLVFVLDTGRGQIQVWNRSLTEKLNTYGSFGAGEGEFSGPQGIAYDSVRKRVIVADTINCRIVVLDLVNESTGQLAPLTSFGSSGTLDGEFRNPHAVAVMPMIGWLFVADTDNNRFQIFQYTGGNYSFFAKKGGLTGPKGIGVDSGAFIYVADTGVHTIRCYGLDGSGPLWSFGGGTVFAFPTDVQFGVRDRMYVTDKGNHRIRVYDISTWGSPVHFASYGSQPGLPGSGPGELKSPQGAAPVLDENVIYVADTGNQRVQKLRTLMDGDGDGMDDIWEELNGLDSTDPNDWDDDPDGDGLINVGEYRIGTNPHAADTNGNGADDGWEVFHGSDAVNSGLSLLVIRDMDEIPRIINWNVVSGGVYRVQFTPDMINVPWTNGPAITSQFEGVYIWTNTVPFVEPKQFFRIQRLNP